MDASLPLDTLRPGWCNPPVDLPRRPKVRPNMMILQANVPATQPTSSHSGTTSCGWWHGLHHHGI